MPAEQIARNLAFINWTLLAGLAVGAFGAVALLRLRTEATKGYLGFTALCAAAFGGLAWLSDGALPASAAAGSPVTVDPAWDTPRRAVLGLFAAGAFVASMALFRGRRAAPLVVGVAVAGGVALILGSLTWGGDTAGTAMLAIQLLALAAATGGIFAAMILGFRTATLGRVDLPCPTSPGDYNREALRSVEAQDQIAEMRSYCHGSMAPWCRTGGRWRRINRPSG